MPKRIVIGFGHKRRRGKDLCGELACAWLRAAGMSARVDWFAYSLKAMCQVVFGFNHEQLYGEDKLKVDPFWGCTPRHALQLGGTEAMRHTFGANVWTRTLERRAAQEPNRSILICDVRFPEEVETVRKLGGVLVHVDRPVHLLPPADTEETGHSSETALDDFTGWDDQIVNDGTVDDLHRRVGLLLKRIGVKVPG